MHHVVMSDPFLPNTPPIREVDERHETLRQIDHHRSGMIQAVAERGLSLAGRLHCRMAIAQNDGTVGAHQVDELVAVDVPVSRAVGPVRVVGGSTGGDEGGRGMTVDPARNHLPRPLEKLPGSFDRQVRRTPVALR